jgi:hypothetical protein
VKAIPAAHPLRHLFRRVTRAAVDSTGMRRDPDIELHISEEILARFVHIDNLYRIRNVRGKRLTEIAEILLEADAGHMTGISDEVLFHEYIGDYALFMTGIFPASVRRTARVPSGHDHLLMKFGSLFLPFDDPVDYYVAQGRAAYAKASELSRPFRPHRAMVLRELANRFESFVALMGLIAAYLEADPYFRKAKGIIS